MHGKSHIEALHALVWSAIMCTRFTGRCLNKRNTFVRCYCSIIQIDESNRVSLLLLTYQNVEFSDLFHREPVLVTLCTIYYCLFVCWKLKIIQDYGTVRPDESKRKAYFYFMTYGIGNRFSCKTISQRKQKIRTHFVVNKLLFINVTYCFNWYLEDNLIFCISQCDWSQCGCFNATLRAVINQAFTFVWSTQYISFRMI
jgi:hypothetical protein